jgi:hypothetical protein
MRRQVILLCAAVRLCAQVPVESAVSVPGGRLLYFHAEPQPAAQPRPVLVVLPAVPELSAVPAYWKEWQGRVASRSWLVVVPWGEFQTPGLWGDLFTKLLAALVEDVPRRLPADTTRLYLAGEAGLASHVFYVASRAPHLVAAGLAIGGDPKRAIETNRLFGANTRLSPVLWLVERSDSPLLERERRRLQAAQYNFELRPLEQTPLENALEWLAKHSRDPFPEEVDCETGNPDFARCHWLEITRFDASQRNDVLRSTRVQPGAGGYLDLGGFGYDPSAPEPGVRVVWLPPDYKGPLKLGDRIVSVGGRAIKDAQDYLTMMDEAEEKPAAVIVERGKERLRLETRILVARREETATARVQGRFLADTREILVVTRGVGELKMQVPPQWAPARVNWNGNDLGSAERPGCWIIALPAARPCP